MSGAGSADQSPSGPVFEAIVLLGLERRLAAYCQAARGETGIDPATLRIRAVIITVEPPPGRPSRFQAAAQRVVQDGLPGARVRVLFDRQDGVGEPGYRISLYPPLPAASSSAGPRTTPAHDFDSPATMPMQQRPEPGPASAAAAALTLRYGDWRWRYLLPDVDAWLPLGRGLRGVSPSMVRIPDFAAVVPRGPLLLIRHHAGIIRLHRSNERRNYLVRIDGRALPPGHSLPAGAAGQISYGLTAARNPTGHTEVSYELLATEVR